MSLVATITDTWAGFKHCRSYGELWGHILSAGRARRLEAVGRSGAIAGSATPRPSSPPPPHPCRAAATDPGPCHQPLDRPAHGAGGHGRQGPARRLEADRRGPPGDGGGGGARNLGQGKDRNVEVSCSLTSLGPDRSGPEELLSLVRKHWHIEKRLHYVRDFTYDEDCCWVHGAPSAPQSRLPHQRGHRHRALPLVARGQPPLRRPRPGNHRRDPGRRPWFPPGQAAHELEDAGVGSPSPRHAAIRPLACRSRRTGRVRSRSSAK